MKHGHEVCLLEIWSLNLGDMVSKTKVIGKPCGHDRGHFGGLNFKTWSECLSK